MILPLLVTVAVYVVSRHRALAEQDASAESVPAPPAKRARCWLVAGSGAWFLAGALGAATVWYKYTAIPILAFLFAAWSIEQWRQGARAAMLARLWLFGLLGATMASLIVLSPFLVRDGARHLWECTVLFNRFYRSSATFGTAGFWSVLEALWIDWWVLFLLLPILLVRRRSRLWFWMGMFGAAWVSTGASAFGHYYVVVMPFWALLAAVAIHDLAALADSKLAWSEAGFRLTFTTAVVVVLCLPDLPWMVCRKEEFAAVKAGGGNPFVESMAVARRVAALTSPADRVFVAGSEPQILFYANRLSPTRFVILYPLMIPTPLAVGYQQEAEGELERHPPKVIVLARSDTSWLRQARSPPGFVRFLEKLLADRYEQVGGWVVSGQTGRWQEPLPDEDFASASLVLFRRKGP